MTGPGSLGAHRRWVEGHLGPVLAARDASWDHGESDVLRVVGARGAAYLKRHRQPRKFAQELRAYRDWCPRIAGAARLIAATEEHGPALLLAEAPGTLLLGRADLEPGAEREAWRRAGEVLAALHALPHRDDDPMPLPAALGRRCRFWAGRAADAVDAPTVGRVLALVEAPWPDDAPVPRRVPCHRDYTPRNWLLDGATLTVIDFEHARPDWSLVDVSRALGEVPAGRPELARAFKDGYGRPVDGRLLLRLRALEALARVAWAVEHGDAAFEASGRAVLAELAGAGR